jgi:hypothetical protein
MVYLIYLNLKSFYIFIISNSQCHDKLYHMMLFEYIVWLLRLYVVFCDCSDYMLYFVTALTICGILWLLWLYVGFCDCSDYMWYFVTALTICGILWLLWLYVVFFVCFELYQVTLKSLVFGYYWLLESFPNIYFRNIQRCSFVYCF